MSIFVKTLAEVLSIEELPTVPRKHFLVKISVQNVRCLMGKKTTKKNIVLFLG